MKILAGGPAADIEAAYFEASSASVKGQKTDHELHVQYIVDQDTGDFEVTHDNHIWSNDSVLRVGRMRQDFLDLAAVKDYDAAWFVDTDLVLGPRTLEIMLDVDAPIVFGVFWTTWAGQQGPLPQVWDAHPYSFNHTTHNGRKTFPTIRALQNNQELEVVGGGACTLIRKEAFGKAQYHPPLKGMPWWGEDRDFCARAQVHNLRMVATPRPDIVHLYTTEQRSPEAIAQAQELVGITKPKDQP
jgi:hypothetical protein